MANLSRPIEDLIQPKPDDGVIAKADAVIVGSGYGGAVAAVRLAGKDRRVLVLERGKEYGPGDFPYDENDLPAHLRIVQEQTDGSAMGYSDALFNLYPGGQTDTLVGSGLGGTSLINANVAEAPEPHVFKKAGWPRQFSNSDDPLRDEFLQIKRLLSVGPHEEAASLTKYQALQKLSNALNQHTTSATLKPANIAVSFNDGPNAVGVKQFACSDCGNCVTGCNIGAKNTLDRNLLPLAKARGAEIYTGVTVLSIQQNKKQNSQQEKTPTKRYIITVKATVQIHGTIRAKSYEIHTDNIVLSAGTLGSTEILLRSQQLKLMDFSKKLGERFSTNGDGLIMSYGHDSEVGGIAGAEQNNPTIKPGPTITGLSRVVSENPASQDTHLTIEDAAIPASISRFFKEAVVTSAMIQRLTNRKVPKFIKAKGIDPLAASPLAAKHSQALLIMGDDGANGALSLKRVEDGHENEATLEINFPNVAQNPALVVSNRLVKQQDRKAGLDSGQYVPNPLWQLLPEEDSAAISGALPKGRAITVHPLGGCAMGDSIDHGVVDHSGNVFCPDHNSEQQNGNLTYEGLYVLDGAIIPTALEVNPFLTIAALAWRNSGLILDLLGWEESQITEAEGHSIGTIPNSPPREQDAAAFLIREQLFGKLTSPLPAFDAIDPAINKRLLEQDGLLVEVEAGIPDVDGWLDQNVPLAASMKLYTHPFPVSDVHLYRPYGIAKKHLQHAPFQTLTGTFHLLKEDRYCLLTDLIGGLRAFITYNARRDNLLRMLMQSLGSWLRSSSGEKAPFSGLKRLAVFFNIGAMQSRKRRLIYHFENDTGQIRIKGEKVLGYDLSLPRLWPGLLNLEAELSDGATRVKTNLQVNAEYITEAGFLKLVSPNELTTSSAKQPPNNNPISLPQAIFSGLSVGGLFARSLFSTNFWEFAGLDYPDSPIEQKTLPIAILSGNQSVEPVFTELQVAVSCRTSKKYSMLMTHYPNPGKPPILLIHGLAQGSQIYWTNTLSKNLVSYMHEAGFDVWTVDYRLSNHVIPHMPDLDWSMDEIAEYDIPAMINHVYGHSNQPVTIFGHCVGACSLAMSTLANHVDNNKIQSAVVNAIHPWVETSPTNRVRSRFGQFNRDWIKTDHLNPIPSNDGDAAQNLFDRLAFGFAKIRELELDDHKHYGSDDLSNGVCNRMSLLYGRMWNHKNLNPETHADFIHMFGPAPSKVYQHLYYYSLQKRITDQNGDNVYLQDQHIRQRWTFPTLFIHGDDSRVFNPCSAIRSAERLAQFTTRNDHTLLTQHKIYPDYGHMDVIFGKDAYKTVYPDALGFYQQANIERRQPIPSYEVLSNALPNNPNMGPILRSAWIFEGHIHMRFWLEAKVNLTNKQNYFDVIGNDVERVNLQNLEQSSGPSKQCRHWLMDIKIKNPRETVSFKLYCAGHQPPSDKTGIGGIELTLKDQGWYKQLRKQLDAMIEDCSFLVGSCRFPGTVIDRERSDSIFAQMNKHTSDTQAVFLLGDQVYADATDQLFNITSLRAKYRYRYERAFSKKYSPEFAALTKSSPTHFSLDDHEFEDGWAGRPEQLPNTTPLEQARRDSLLARSEYGLRNAIRFQSSGRDQSKPFFAKAETPFSYALERSELTFPAFLLDSRSSRKHRHSDDPMAQDMFDDAVRASLESWLRDAQSRFGDAPKFLMSGSVIAPINRSYSDAPSLFRRQDNWHGYPKSVQWLFDFLLDNQIQNLVLIGGDEHLSAVAKLSIEQSATASDLSDPAAPPITAWQIVASALYSPLPFANSGDTDFLWDQEVAIPLPPGSSSRACYTATKLSSCASQFVRVNACRQQVVVSCYDASNTMLNSRHFDLRKKAIISGSP